MADKIDQTRSIVIAATFTAEPLQPSLEFLLSKAGLETIVRFSPYHQVLQELISASSSIASIDKGAAVLLVRLEDFVRDIEDPLRSSETILAVADDLAAALSAFTARAKVPVVFSVLPASPNVRKELRAPIDKAADRLIERASYLSGLSILSVADIEAVALSNRYDSESDELAHVPFTEEHYASLSLAIARKVHAIFVPDRKVLVLDCDNTLWHGVVGEDGVDGITVPPAFVCIQKFALRLQSQGVLLCLASKNSEQDVLNVLEQRPDMLLKVDHIVAHRINWSPKPQNIIELAQSLSLGLDSFVFIDDNPVECELMQAELPQVLTLLLPPEDQIESFLDHLWAFDKLTVTDEDRRRTNLYKEDAARKEIEKSSTNIIDFVASLKVKVDISAPSDADWPRLAQLTQRTNQFNFTTVRRTESELRTLVGNLPDQAGRVLRVNVSDRFGDYGLVGLVICVETDRELLVDTFLLSCRVLGRGVEHTILRHLGEIAKARNLNPVCLPFAKTARNEPASAFADSVAMAFKSEEGDRSLYRIPTSAALEIHHRPGHDPDAVMQAKDADGKKPVLQSSVPNANERYRLFSQKLLTGDDVLRAMSTGNMRRRSLPGDPAAAKTETERLLLAIWREILAVEDLGVEDGYSEVGGSSLLAARLFATISQRFGAKLPLTTILEYPTVRELATLLDENRSRIPSLVKLRGGGSRNFFFIHDGDGETLLYQNLARRLPAGFNAYGIEPRQLQNIPLAHSSIEDMATYYLGLIRGKQPAGPYFLGGMCAGGVIAFEVAKQLIMADQKVGLVALLDSALPGTARRRGRIAKQRADRIAELLAADGQGSAWGPKVAVLVRKAVNAAFWEVKQRTQRLSVRARFHFLQRILRNGFTWPYAVPSLTVRQIYDTAELGYRPSPVSLPALLLVRAQSGQGGDIPFREVYADDELGWRRVSDNLLVEDVDGGHYTMLQEPFAGAVAEKIAAVINSTAAPSRSSAHFKASA